MSRWRSAGRWSKALAGLGLLVASGAGASEAPGGAQASRSEVRARFRQVHREAEQLGVRIVRLRGMLRRGPHRPDQETCLDRALTASLSLQRRIEWFLRADRAGRGHRPPPELQSLRARVVERDLRETKRQVRACLAPETQGEGTVVRVQARPRLSGEPSSRWQTPPPRPEHPHVVAEP